jgi:phospholipase/carboxylesterase
LKIRQFGRRQFLLTSFATFATTLVVKNYAQNSTSALELNDSGGRGASNSLQFISVPSKNGQSPTGLIVCLHGSAGKAQKLKSFATALNLPKYQFLFPDAPFRDSTVREGKSWYDLKSQDYKGLTTSRQLLTNWLKSLESTTGVPLERTILSGFSQGGAMALDVGLTLPLAGLVVLSGYLHSSPQLTARKSYPPVLMMHGRQDSVVTLDEAKSARDRLKALGVPLNYQEFDMEHEFSKAELASMRRFVMNAIK